MNERLELLCYLRVLLQEIANGYDNARYRVRGYFGLLKCSGVDTLTAIRWKNRGISTIDMLSIIESLILNASKQADPAK